MATIVIADDSYVTRAVLAILLEGAGHQVLGQFENGRDALRAVPTLRPDVLLVDMLMPHLDGLDVVRGLRAQGLPTKIIMLSSVSVLAKVREAKAVGVDYYILKPFEGEKVLDTVARCLQGLPVAV